MVVAKISASQVIDLPPHMLTILSIAFITRFMVSRNSARRYSTIFFTPHHESESALVKGFAQSIDAHIGGSGSVVLYKREVVGRLDTVDGRRNLISAGP